MLFSLIQNVLSPVKVILLFLNKPLKQICSLFIETTTEALLSKKKKGLKYGACPYHPRPHLASLISFLQNNVAPSPTAD